MGLNDECQGFGTCDSQQYHATESYDRRQRKLQELYRTIMDSAYKIANPTEGDVVPAFDVKRYAEILEREKDIRDNRL